MLKFKCPNCGTANIEEIQCNVTVVSQIDIDDNGAITYGEQTNEGGHVLRYQCEYCGHVIVSSSDGDDIEEELLKKIRDQKPIQPD